MTEEHYMTAPEFAAKIGIHPQTLRKWDNNGTLPAHHRSPGGRRFYSATQAEAYFNGNYGFVKKEGTKNA